MEWALAENINQYQPQPLLVCSLASATHTWDPVSGISVIVLCFCHIRHQCVSDLHGEHAQQFLEKSSSALIVFFSASYQCNPGSLAVFCFFFLNPV